MIYKILLTFILAFALPTKISYAQSEFRPVLGDEMKEKMFNIERTFWSLTDIDRFNFKPDGTLQHQINQEWGNIPLGTILNATWRIKNDKSLCWTYREDTVKNHNIASQELCFDLFTPESKEIFMVGNHPDIRLKPEGQSENSKSVFRFFSWHRGDYSFDPEYIEDVYQAMNIMKIYRDKYRGNIPNGTINRSAMNTRMQGYYDFTIGRVFLVNVDYMYFDPTGDFYWLRHADMENKTLEEMLEAVRIGTWSVKDNIICWRVSSIGCEYIFPKGKGLLNQSFDTYLGTFISGMTRKHVDTIENVLHLDFEETPAPELFERLAQASIDARKK